MHAIRTSWVVLAVALASMSSLGAGCAANMAPVLNVAATPATGAPPGTDPTAHVRQSIMRALASKGWAIDEEKPNLITATVRKEPLFATVDIAYSGQNFGITHKASAPEFKFDGTIIHRRYNHWVDRLRSAIVAELARPSAGPGAPPPAVASPD